MFNSICSNLYDISPTYSKTFKANIRTVYDPDPAPHSSIPYLVNNIKLYISPADSFTRILHGIKVHITYKTGGLCWTVKRTIAGSHQIKLFFFPHKGLGMRTLVDYMIAFEASFPFR